MIVFNNPAHGFEIAKAAGCMFNPACDVTIGHVEGDKLLGGVFYQNFTGESISMHVGSFRKNWVTKDLIWACFHYPFVQLGVKRIFGQVPETNTKALEFDLRIGFKVLTKVDGVFPDGGMILVVMERDDCRWLGLKPRGLSSEQEI